MENMNRKADRWGPVAAAARGAGRRAGMGDALGRKLGWLREWGWPAAVRASWAGRLLCAGEPSRPGLLWAFFPSLVFLFYFSSPLFEFKFGLKFEFQIGAPYSLEF